MPWSNNICSESEAQHLVCWRAPASESRSGKESDVQFSVLGQEGLGLLALEYDGQGLERSSVLSTNQPRP
jgi:hypothetical protein